MKPRILTTLLICSATLMTTATPAIAATVPASKATTQVPASVDASSSQISKGSDSQTPQEIPAAFIDLGIQDGKLTDFKNQSQWQSTGTPTVTTDGEMNGNVLNFDGSSAFYTTFTDDQFSQLKNGLTIEAYFKYDRYADADSEHEIFSSQESGGFGLGVQKNKIVFYAHDGGGYKQPSGELKPGKWVHAVGVIDKIGRLVCI